MKAKLEEKLKVNTFSDNIILFHKYTIQNRFRKQVQGTFINSFPTL